MGKIREQKREQREYYLSVRDKIGSRNRRELSRSICKNLVNWELYHSSSIIHCFMSIENSSEVETGPILRQLIRDKKQIVLSRSDPETREMDHIPWSEHDPLNINRWGIPEPVGEETIDPNEIDLVLIPAVAADLQKNRLGYGLGFYDRFLSKTGAVKACLLFEACLSEQPLPVGKLDVKLDTIITENKIY